MSVTFSDIHDMLAARPPLAAAFPCALVKNIAALQSDCVHLSEDWTAILENLAQIQQKNWPQLKHPRVALYAANYGQKLHEMQVQLQKLNSQQHALTRLCAMINADLRVYELDLSSVIPAQGIDEIAACHAISYGLMAVEEHVDCLLLETLSPGAEAVLTQWETALAAQPDEDALRLLQQCGAGHDLFALLGAVFAARMAKIPVFGTTRLNVVLAKAFQRLLPNETPVYLKIPQVFAAPDIIETLAAVQNLQFILALGPQTDSRLVQPKAA